MLIITDRSTHHNEYENMVLNQSFFSLLSKHHHRSCELIQNVGINKKINQNIVERLHGTLNDMLRSRRGMSKNESTESMLDGWFVYYNFLRPHSSLGGKTPAEVAGIELNLSNRWESLIVSYKMESFKYCSLRF